MVIVYCTGRFFGHVENLTDGYERVQDGQGWGIRSTDGERLLGSSDSFDMVVDNT